VGRGLRPAAGTGGLPIPGREFITACATLKRRTDVNPRVLIFGEEGVVYAATIGIAGEARQPGMFDTSYPNIGRAVDAASRVSCASSLKFSFATTPTRRPSNNDCGVPQVTPPICGPHGSEFLAGFFKTAAILAEVAQSMKTT